MFSREGIKYPCRQCGQEFLKRGCLVKHLRAVHDRVKFPCVQFSQRENLAKHQVDHMKESNTLVGNAENNFFRGGI